MKLINWLILLSVFVLIACNKDDDDTSVTQPLVLQQEEPVEQVLNLPETPYNYSVYTVPNHFGAPPITNLDNTPNTNPVTDEGATLGRVLFYDKSLSLNNSVACASCHKQELAFSDDAAFSTGFEEGLTGRNSMGLSNAMYYENEKFFWDERAATLEEQVLMPIQDPIEMGMDLDNLVEKLETLSYYKELFENAFGTTEITSEKISLALAQFVRSMVSYQSKLDEGLAQIQGPAGPTDDVPGFSAEENRGREIFNTPQLGGCSGCHATELQVGIEALNNGLDASTTDGGLADVTGLTTDEGKFKVPSLRNIELTGPFMHDGRFTTLTEVIEHYNSGVENHPNLDNRLRVPGQPNQVKRLNLSTSDKLALEAFLKTLTDQVFLTDEKFSDPFID